ncbi:hypothetical protein [Vibrio sonorensis]|uniref:hypothetical protein n=1 Tax=Vibrio sonorensis TaxID=1004316 RepID=UPI0008DA6B23|nr:hypothetical protein [Vibrio sonorensis]
MVNSTPKKNRFQSHSPLNNMVSEDWKASILLDPDNWDAQLYIPIPQTEASDESDFRDLDTNQKVIEYADPIPVKCADINEPTQRIMENSGEYLLSNGESVLTVRIGHDPVPDGSSISWLEDKGNGKTTEVTWYVQQSRGIGVQSSMKVYDLILSLDSDQELDAPDELVTSSVITNEEIDALTDPTLFE